MEPRIQYAKTSDGVSIAYWTLGEGLPLVIMPAGIFSHIQLEWQAPELRRWYERLSETRRLVRYDDRGVGLSDRDVIDFSLDALLLDLDTVVDRLGLDRFALHGTGNLGPAAIAYAVRHPERVSHLILSGTWARGSDYWRSSRVEAITAIREKDWRVYTETVGYWLVGRSNPDLARQFAAFFRECITPEALDAFVVETREFDVTALLSEVRSPTLVLHRRRSPFPPVDTARGLASRIPDAQLVVLEGTSRSPLLGNLDALVQAIDEFLSEGEEAAGAPGLAPDDVYTILFTDIESSAALRQRLGDARAQDLVRVHNSIVRDALKDHAGTEIKHTGDGIMASFSSAVKALEAAIDMQRGVAEYAEEHPDLPLAVYIGLNAGEPIAEEQPDGRGDLFGTSVDLASRICGHAEPGQIVVSNVVRELAAGKEFLFADLGETELRGFEDPVRVYEVRWREG